MEKSYKKRTQLDRKMYKTGINCGRGSSLPPSRMGVPPHPPALELLDDDMF